MADNVIEIQYQPDGVLVVKFQPHAISLFPAEVKEHMVGARKEMLLAIRAMLDKAITKTEEQAKPKGSRRTKIDVQ